MLLVRDLRDGARLLVRHKPFAIAAFAVMALGIGATTAVFSVVRAVLLRPLPYRAPDRLVLFRADGPGVVRRALLTGHELAAIRTRPDLFASIAVINESAGNLTTPGEMTAVTAASPSDNFMETLGTGPMMGRMVSRRDIGPRWVSAVDISYELWQRQWHGDPSIVGRQIDVNNIPVTVVGVLPAEFRLYLGPNVPVSPRIDVWFPRAAGYDEGPTRTQTVLARLRDGVTREAAQTALDGLSREVMAAQPEGYRAGAVRLTVSAVDAEVTSDVKPALLALSGAVAFVLLVACANLMNLLLAHATARTRELAVRAAIGASRARLVAQLAAESLLLGAAGALGGLLAARWGVDALLRLAPAALPRREAIAIDAGIALFAIAASLVCALVFGLMPAWQATRADVVDMMKQDPAAPRHASATRGLLVAAQIALSLVLLVGAGLMARALVSMRSVPLGFDPRDAVTMNVHLQVQRFNDGGMDASRAKRLAFYHELADSVRQIPGVEQVGTGLFVPLSGSPITMRYSAGIGRPEYAADGAIALAGFLETLRVPIVAGRFFTADDDNRPVVIVDRQLATQMWPNASPIGQRLMLPRPSGPASWVEVVGVVEHVQMDGIRRRALPEIFVTYVTRQYADLSIVVRAPHAMALVPAIDAAVQRLGPGRPVHDVRMLDGYVADASADTRFALFVLGAFAVIAVVLTAVGVYGVVAYSTARRTREIALRLALGAAPARIVALVVRDGLAWIAAGLAAGVGGALALSRSLAPLLFGVGARDPITFAFVAALLAAVALAATVAPALRAVRVDPMLALRSE